MTDTSLPSLSGRPPPLSFPSRRREVLAWAMYDWANSAYSTLLITVVLHYLQKVVLPGKAGEVAYPLGIGAAMLVAAVLSPIVGAVADANRSKRRWLCGTTLCGVAAAGAMALAPVDQAWIVVAAFVLMGTCFELSLVPYNGFLTEISDERTINRISALGFALGYIGGSVPLVIAWAISHYGENLGLPGEMERDRVGILLLGLWWGAFSLPALWILRDRGRRPERLEPLHRAARIAMNKGGRTLANIRLYPVLAMFLLAFFFFNDGVQTVITQSTAIAVKELKFSIDEVYLLVLMIQLIALPGSLTVGWLSDRLGQKLVLLACLAVWAGLLVSALYVESKTAFCVMGVVLAFVLGGTQSVSRAMMGVLTPPEHAGEFFGFYNLSGKAASVMGPVQFGAVIYFTGNARLAAVSLLVFFLVGGVILARLRIKT